jgi:hypothetical protein
VIDAGLDPESIDSAFAPRRNAAVQLVPVDGEGILVDGTGALHVLNPTASLLWECFDGDVTIAELADEIAAALDVAPDAVLADAVRIAREFVERGILEDARIAESAPIDASPSLVRAGAGPQVWPEPPNS